ncbi:MAG: hypothetical protein E7600_04890 [Ruminococcaceae bacterium]|nr:hypothetical protein [Oscillospiraceae bacterium]
MKKLLIAVICLLAVTVCILSSCTNTDNEQKTDETMKDNAQNAEENKTENTEDLPVTENTEETLSVLEKYSSLVTVDEGGSLFDAAYLKGIEYEYAVFEVRENSSEDAEYEDYGDFIYWEVVVIKDNEAVTVLRQNYDEFATMLPSVKYLVIELDVNFDGKNDILLHQGNFGAQCAVGYTCHLNTADGFELCQSFPNFNAAISEVGHTVSTLNRDSAAQHSIEYYSYTQDGEYVPFEAVRFMPHSSAYMIYDNAEEFLGEDMSVYDEAEYRCVAVETYNDGEWELYKIYPDEKDSPYYEHKHVCYYENYKPICSLGTELYEYVKF